VLYTNVSCPCSHFSTPRQPHHRPRAGPGPAPAGARERVFDKSCSTYMFLPHVRSFRPPASPITGPELVPRRPRPELGNVYFPCACAHARPRARARSPTSVFAVKGEGGGSVPPSLSDSLLGEQHPNISKICWDAERGAVVLIIPPSGTTFFHSASGNNVFLFLELKCLFVQKVFSVQSCFSIQNAFASPARFERKHFPPGKHFERKKPF